jgi:death on curing protein
VRTPFFLTLADVLGIHADQIMRYGGSTGLRDLGLLDSALAQPQATYSGQWLHDNLYAMAAAYAYHICSNHSFLDGNKRTALASALVFLELNGISLIDAEHRLESMMRDVASGRLQKDGIAEVCRQLAHVARGKVR